ncbi:MAG: tRNA uridine-5-carboxymethylaminomethyl(34) synthesis GTPase MnmE [Bacteroidetes bacterium CG2_30_33_31]|nr:MAG: tRNA uridine-5-carboxymethylaminomethyl(34) synthesis GTPase MnmE [Bacteroidetes bacterium CG2_30_33_31]
MNNDFSFYKKDNIAAIATGGGISAIAIIRCSGDSIFPIISKLFKPANSANNILLMSGYSEVYGYMMDGYNKIDDVILSLFHEPKSYTGENSIEISCHGSIYIQQKIMELLQKNNIRPAEPGEFTMRAFARGKLDLSQAEAVNDLIDSKSEISHLIAMRQLKGNYSDNIKILRNNFIDFASLLELELDFAEEEVEFADRKKFFEFIETIKKEITKLIDSYRLGKVLKSGIPVAIIGKPNVGKSTILNLLLEDDKAIVSDIPGTTRDFIEDTLLISGNLFRIIDTAGLRKSNDIIENLGIEKTLSKIKEASIILYIVDEQGFKQEDLNRIIDFKKDGKTVIEIVNKSDLLKNPNSFESNQILISAKNKINTNKILDQLLKYVEHFRINDNTIVSSARHIDILKKTLVDIQNIKKGFENNIPIDLISIDVREALTHLSEITGQITTDDLLGSIFGKFCIGK